MITGALTGLVDDNFFDMHAENVVVEYVITVPGYPRQVVGRTELAALYRNYGKSIHQTGSRDGYTYYFVKDGWSSSNTRFLELSSTAANPLSTDSCR